GFTWTGRYSGIFRCDRNVGPARRGDRGEMPRISFGPSGRIPARIRAVDWPDLRSARLIRGGLARRGQPAQAGSPRLWRALRPPARQAGLCARSSAQARETATHLSLLGAGRLAEASLF